MDNSTGRWIWGSKGRSGSRFLAEHTGRTLYAGQGRVSPRESRLLRAPRSCSIPFPRRTGIVTGFLWERGCVARRRGASFSGGCSVPAARGSLKEIPNDSFFAPDPSHAERDPQLRPRARDLGDLSPAIRAAHELTAKWFSLSRGVVRKNSAICTLQGVNECFPGKVKFWGMMEHLRESRSGMNCELIRVYCLVKWYIRNWSHDFDFWTLFRW